MQNPKLKVTMRYFDNGNDNGTSPIGIPVPDILCLQIPKGWKELKREPSIYSIILWKNAQMLGFSGIYIQ
jgi:hypothetical protein